MKLNADSAPEFRCHLSPSTPKGTRNLVVEWPISFRYSSADFHRYPHNPNSDLLLEPSCEFAKKKPRLAVEEGEGFLPSDLLEHPLLVAAEKLLVLLRDGRKLSGILRSFDQYANAVLEGACERVGDLYCDIPLGLYVIRGENIVLVGELDMERDDLPPHMTPVSTAEIKRAQKAKREAMDLKGMIRKRMEFLDMD